MVLLHLLVRGRVVPPEAVLAAVHIRSPDAPRERRRRRVGWPGYAPSGGVACHLRRASRPVATEAEGRRAALRPLRRARARPRRERGRPDGAHGRRPGRDGALSSRQRERPTRCGRDPAEAEAGTRRLDGGRAAAAALQARGARRVCSRAQRAPPRGPHQPGPALDAPTRSATASCRSSRGPFRALPPSLAHLAETRPCRVSCPRSAPRRAHRRDDGGDAGRRRGLLFQAGRVGRRADRAGCRAAAPGRSAPRWRGREGGRRATSCTLPERRVAAARSR